MQFTIFIQSYRIQLKTPLSLRGDGKQLKLLGKSLNKPKQPPRTPEIAILTDCSANAAARNDDYSIGFYIRTKLITIIFPIPPRCGP